VKYRLISLAETTAPAPLGDEITGLHFGSCSLKISAEDTGFLYPGVIRQAMVETWLRQGVRPVVLIDGGSEVQA